MFKKTYKALNVANSDANAISPKTDTQASEDSQCEENKQAVLMSATTRLSNQFVQLPPYVYVPSSTNRQQGSSPEQERGQREELARSANVDVLMPQETLLRRSGFPQFFPAQHLYQERMLPNLQPQYIVVSPTFASRPMFSRPYDLSVQAANLAWIQQQQHLQSARLHAPELNSIRMTPPKVETQDESIVPVNDGDGKVPPKPNTIAPAGEESEESRFVAVGEKPKRPLSAYNYFFKDEREKMIRIEMGGDSCSKGNRKNKTKRHGIKFEDMAKAIAKKWNDIGPEALQKFEVMAQNDKERYKLAMYEYNQRKNSALSAVHKELASTVSKEKMEKYLKGTEHEKKRKTA